MGRRGLSPHAERVLGALGDGVRARNVSTVVAGTGLSEDVVREAIEELTSAGLATLEGRRVRRANGSGPGSVSRAARLLLNALPQDGSLRSNLRLRSEVDLDDDAYAAAKQELIDAGRVQVGRGRGGTLGRAEAAEPEEVVREDSARLVARESELYEPFVRWVASSLSGGGLRFSSVRDTASPKRRKRSSGKWSRPDVTAITVSNFEYLPGATVEVLSYEVKRAVDADKIESVYEAAAHGRWAHRASLVVEATAGKPPISDAVQDEAERFRLGLYAMTRRADGSWEIRQIREPDLRTPESENVDQLLREYFLADDGERQNYLVSLK